MDDEECSCCGEYLGEDYEYSHCLICGNYVQEVEDE